MLLRDMQRRAVTTRARERRCCDIVKRTAKEKAILADFVRNLNFSKEKCSIAISDVLELFGATI